MPTCWSSCTGASSGPPTPRLVELAEELAGYPGGAAAPASPTDVVLPLRLASAAGELSFFSIAAHVGTATDVTVDELTIEAFYPADAATAEALRRLQDTS